MITKIIKAVTVVAVLLIFFKTNICFGQSDERTKKSPEEIAKKITDKMKESLLLSDEQYKQVYDLNLDKINAKKSNKEKYKTLDKEIRKNLKKQSRDEYIKSLENILTPDQLSQYKSYISEKQKSKKNKNKSRNE